MISKGYIGEKSKVEIISGTDKVMAIEVHDPSMVGEVGFDLQIMEIFRKYKVSYILKSTNANSITQVIWQKDLQNDLINDLKEKFQEITVKEVALICVLGTNIAQPGILAKAATTLAKNNINIESFSQSLKQVNMQFVIPCDQYRKGIIALNDALCVN